MKLRFIGKDGSMGLKHGEVYYVEVYSCMGFINVKRIDSNWMCPYASIKNFTANWKDA